MSELAINAGTSQPVIDSLQIQGFQFNTRMEISLPEVPSDLTELDDEGLMNLFGELTSYANFLNAQFACAVIDEKNAEHALDFEEAKHYVSAYETNKKETVTIMKARMATDPQIIHLREASAAKYAYRKLLEVMVGNIERSTMLVSRELTRRTSGGNAFTRGQRMFP
jgi:hypothetical protein